VFAAADDWLVGLAAVRDGIPAEVPYAPSVGLLAGVDKLELAKLARSSGLKAPRTVIATPDALACWEWPAVVKPRSHWVEGSEDPPVRLATTVAPDEATAQVHVAELEAHGNTALLQEHLSGRLLALTMLMNSASQGVATVQQVADRVWPLPAGVSTRAVTVKVDVDLAARVKHLLQSLRWVGLAQAQFLLTGSGPVLIDLNPRYYGSMALAVRAGVDWPVLWARLATGRPVPDRSDAALGIRYSWLEGDLRRAAVERRGTLVADVGSTFRWAAGSSHSVLDVWDPWPGVRFCGVLAGRVGRHARRRMRR
jgi:predicted ATP-grasp superfamily ATP-dependent carboligase